MTILGCCVPAVLCWSGFVPQGTFGSYGRESRWHLGDEARGAALHPTRLCRPHDEGLPSQTVNSSVPANPCCWGKAPKV